MINRVIVVGRTTKDIELRTTSSGKSIVSFSIAVNSNYKKSDGTNDSYFFNCVAFSGLAETISRYVHKGDLVGISGRLQTRSYTDSNGNNRTVTEIIIDEIDFLQSKKQKPEEAEYYEEIDPFDDLPFDL